MLDFILDLIFPKKCVGCGKEGSWFCQSCLCQISFCEEPFIRLTRSPLDGLIAVAYFRDPLREAIHAFKYDGVKELARPFSELVVQHLKNGRINFVKNSIIIPIPLFKTKEIERGFNQAELLAREIGTKLDLKVLNGALVKIKNTKPQIQLKKEDRKKNVKGAFAFIGDKKIIKNKTVLLVDDVTTTSSTLKEAASVLKKAGAKRIWGLVLAKD